jgi:hypothetical protein
MEKTLKILEGELQNFERMNRSGSRIYKDEFYKEYYKVKRIIKINKIWKKDTH